MNRILRHDSYTINISRMMVCIGAKLTISLVSLRVMKLLFKLQVRLNLKKYFYHLHESCIACILKYVLYIVWLYVGKDLWTDKNGQGKVRHLGMTNSFGDLIMRNNPTRKLLLFYIVHLCQKV